MTDEAEQPFAGTTFETRAERAERAKMTDEADIVERLLAPDYWMSGSKDGHEGMNGVPVEAAAEITALRARVAVLEGAKKWGPGVFDIHCGCPKCRARAALQEPTP